jgi:CelD/BcsL family acetyltransferase involved in cellulose biosynthesis
MSDFFGIVGNLRMQLDSDELLRAAGLSAFRFDHGVPALCPFSFKDAEARCGTHLYADNFTQLKERLLNTNKNFVKSVLYRERRLCKELGAIEFCWKSAAPEALDLLIATKRRQYVRTHVVDSLADAWKRRLLRWLLALPPAPDCEAVLSTLHAGGKWIASKLSLVCTDTLHSWFSVYDPQYRRHGPGHLVWFKVIEAGCAKGVRYFDFGEGESDYKAEYKGERYELWKGVIRRNTLSGLSERVLQSLEWKLNSFQRPLGSLHRGT